MIYGKWILKVGLKWISNDTISRALEGQYIALRPTKDDGLIDVFYCHQKIKTLDLRAK